MIRISDRADLRIFIITFPHTKKALAKDGTEQGGFTFLQNYPIN
jgi:hypothetical protein